MEILNWVGKHGCLVAFLGVFVLVPIIAAVFRAGRSRAFRCPQCGFSNTVEVVKAKDDDDDDD